MIKILSLLLLVAVTSAFASTQLDNIENEQDILNPNDSDALSFFDKLSNVLPFSILANSQYEQIFSEVKTFLSKSRGETSSLETDVEYDQAEEQPVIANKMFKIETDGYANVDNSNEYIFSSAASALPLISSLMFLWLFLSI